MQLTLTHQETKEEGQLNGDKTQKGKRGES